VDTRIIDGKANSANTGSPANRNAKIRHCRLTCGIDVATSCPDCSRAIIEERSPYVGRDELPQSRRLWLDLVEQSSLLQKLTGVPWQTDRAPVPDATGDDVLRLVALLIRPDVRAIVLTILAPDLRQLVEAIVSTERRVA
jgi:Zn-finger nucleic acid-binding protein